MKKYLLAFVLFLFSLKGFSTQIVGGEIYYNPPPVEGCAPVTVSFSDATFADPSITSILWDFGDGNTSLQNSPNHVYMQPGVYDVKVSFNSSNACLGNKTFTVTAMVTVHPSPIPGLSATPTTLTAFDTVVTFTDRSQGATNCWIFYGDGDSSNNCSGTHAYAASGAYTVTQILVNEYGCRAQYGLQLDVDLDALFWIPNAFTPNQDGKNELFMPVAMGVQNFNMMIFDRWGNLIFETNDITKGWDGKVKGNRCEEDVYVWKASFEKSGDDTIPYKRIGHVTLVH